MSEEEGEEVIFSTHTTYTLHIPHPTHTHTHHTHTHTPHTHTHTPHTHTPPTDTHTHTHHTHTQPRWGTDGGYFKN